MLVGQRLACVLGVSNDLVIRVVDLAGTRRLHGGDDGITGHRHGCHRRDAALGQCRHTRQGLRSDGFATFLGDGSAAHCVTHIAKNAGPLTRGTADVTRVTLDGSQAIATATIISSRPTPTDFYFVETEGVWKLNSIGERH